MAALDDAESDTMIQMALVAPIMVLGCTIAGRLLRRVMRSGIAKTYRGDSAASCRQKAVHTIQLRSGEALDQPAHLVYDLGLRGNYQHSDLGGPTQRTAACTTGERRPLCPPTWTLRNLRYVATTGGPAVSVYGAGTGWLSPAGSVRHEAWLVGGNRAPADRQVAMPWTTTCGFVVASGQVTLAVFVHVSHSGTQVWVKRATVGVDAATRAATPVSRVVMEDADVDVDGLPAVSRNADVNSEQDSVLQTTASPLCADTSTISAPLCNDGTEEGVVFDRLSGRHSCIPSHMGRGGAADGDNVNSRDRSSGIDAGLDDRASLSSRPGAISFAGCGADGVNQPATVADSTPAVGAEQKGEEESPSRTALSSSNTTAPSNHDGGDLVFAGANAGRSMSSDITSVLPSDSTSVLLPCDSTSVLPSHSDGGRIPASGADGGKGNVPMAHVETTADQRTGSGAGHDAIEPEPGRTDSSAPPVAAGEDSSSEPRRRIAKPHRGKFTQDMDGTTRSVRASGGGMTILAPVDGFVDPSSRKAKRKARALKRRQLKPEEHSGSVASSMHMKKLGQTSIVPVVDKCIGQQQDAAAVAVGVIEGQCRSDQVEVLPSLAGQRGSHIARLDCTKAGGRPRHKRVTWRNADCLLGISISGRRGDATTGVTHQALPIASSTVKAEKGVGGAAGDGGLGRGSAATTGRSGDGGVRRSRSQKAPAARLPPTLPTKPVEWDETHHTVGRFKDPSKQAFVRRSGQRELGNAATCVGGLGPNGPGVKTLLQDVERLFNGSHPGVERVTPWFGQLLVRTRGDGNCFFASSMISCVLDAAMDLSKMTALVGKAQVVKKTDAYRALGETPRYQAAVDSFLGYLAGLKRKLHSHSMGPGGSGKGDATFGVSLGATFVMDLTAKGGSHVRLYRGMVLVARILDLVHAPQGTPEDYVSALAKVNTNVDFAESNADRTAFQLPAMKPGHGLGMTVGLLMERYLPPNSQQGRHVAMRSVEDASESFFEDDRAKTPVASGIKLRRGELQHFDVVLPADSALGSKLTEMFEIDVSSSDHLDHLEALRLERASQEQMSTADVLICEAAADTELEQQKWLLANRVQAILNEDHRRIKLSSFDVRPT